MALSFDIPESPKNYINSMTDFLGVDFNNPLECDVRHSPNMKNMLLKDGYLKKRKGLKIKCKINDEPIYGIWNYDVPGDTLFNEIFIVHCGNKLYEVSSDFSVITQIMTNLAENDSWGMFLGDKLVILDGKKAIIYGKYGNSYGAHYMEDVAYIPRTNISLTPDGMNGTQLESANLLTQFRQNSFLGDGESVIYKTDSTTISASPGDTTIWILNNNTGNWDEVASTDYTVDANNIITFNSPPPAPVVTGADNVKIQFKSTTSDLANLINRCRFCVPFGYQGNNQRLFFSGNPDQPNVDWHSELVESQPDPTYVPDDTFAVIGSQPIVGYLRLSDGTLATLKGLSDTDCSIYYRTSNAQGRWDIFPLLSGTKNTGCLSPYTCCNAIRDAIFLGESGVYSAVTGEASSTLERYADNKSYYINKKLLQEPNLNKAKAISINEFYYLAVNNKMYVADTTKLTQTKNNTIYQYQWYLFDNIPVRSLLRWNNQIIIGDNEGYIKMFGNDYLDELRFVDTVGKNIFDGDFRQGSQSDTTVGTKICNNTNILLKANQKYSFSTSLSDSYKFLVSLNTQQLPTENNNFYTSSWVTDGAITFIPSQDGYFGVIISTLSGNSAITPEDVSSFTFQLEKGDPTQYEPYTITPITETQNVDCYFETIPLDFSNPTIAKTTRTFILNYIAPETTKFEFGYKTIDESEVESEEIYKIVDGSFSDDLSEYEYLPYGTKLLFDENVIYNYSEDGISGYLYGTQTDTIKTFFGFLIKDNILHLGTFSLDITDIDDIKIETLKEIYNSEEGYKMNSLIVKKKLDLLHTINDVLQIEAPTITPSADDGITIIDSVLNEIPQTIRVKEKARKIMFLKIYVKSEKYACEFDRIFLEYRKAGKYRGE